MAKYDNSFTDELRQRLSLVDVISRRVPLVKKGQNYWGCCPFHNEKTPSFAVNEEKGFYHCFGCGEHGDIISFTMKSQNINFVDAIKELADMAGIKMPEYKQKSKEQIEAEENYIQITEKATQIYQDLLYQDSGKIALEYIKKRGFTDEMIKKYRIGYAPKNNIISARFNNIKIDKLTSTGLVRIGDYGPYDFFRDKLMFPIYNAHNQIVAFSGRSLDGSEPKYINTTDTELFHKKQTIFGFNFARDAIHKNNRS
ncbi:MAG: DNA primase, partial [Alphaproteobacteria bacterium]|nr:DNA primase [Alphaproteobacteria bacterium]